MFDEPFQGFPCQIQAIKSGITALKRCHDPQGLCIMVKPPIGLHALMQRILPSVTEGWVPEIMGQGESLGQIFIQFEGARQRAGDLGHFQSVGQSRPIVIPFMIDKNLCLVFKTAKCRRMNDPVSVALKFTARG